MIVSIALLGFGASGTGLILLPALRNGDPQKRLGQLGLATGISIFVAYLVMNWLPFDSFSIAWDRRQLWILILHYLALTLPFFFSGLALGLLLSNYPQLAGKTYSVNLLGSAAGCILALVAPAALGGEGLVTLSIALVLLAGLISLLGFHPHTHTLLLFSTAFLILTLIDLGSRFANKKSFPCLDLHISPYKNLSYVLQYPGSKLVQSRWNASSRVDVVRSPSIHSVPGLSYRYLVPLPSMDGLLVDGDDLSPIIQPEADPGFTSYLPNALALRLRPQADVLVFEPRGGLDIVTALSLSSGRITAVEINPLIIHAAPIYNSSRVQAYSESDRSYLRRTRSKFDVIIISLASSFHPVRSGAYTLVEDYRYTVESFTDALANLNPDGLLVATHWLQDPPSEDLRLFALAVTALEKTNADPRLRLVAFRGFNTGTVLVKNGVFTSEEMNSIRTFLSERAFDLSYAPGIQPDETNRFNILKESKYYQTYSSLLNSNPREKFYNEYEYDVRPPTDDHPFFGHYFKWSQARQILAEFGKTWQPFGGAGYFVVIALLILASMLSAALIFLPIAILSRTDRRIASSFSYHHLLYFGSIGFAFLFVEIPLLQKFILYLGNPAYAFTSVLFALLFFSGLGSRISDRIPLRYALATLVVLLLVTSLLLSRFFAWTLGLPLAIRISLTIFSLSPLGLLMGIPFPAGIRLVQRKQAGAITPQLEGDNLLNHSSIEAQDVSIPWIWAVNGAASVVASILSALLALTFGFSFVLSLAALFYAAAWLTLWGLPVSYRSPRQHL